MGCNQSKYKIILKELNIFKIRLNNIEFSLNRMTDFQFENFIKSIMITKILNEYKRIEHLIIKNDIIQINNYGDCDCIKIILDDISDKIKNILFIINNKKLEINRFKK